MTYATTQRAIAQPGIRPRDPLASSTFSTGKYDTLTLGATVTPKISLKTFGDRTVGTIQHSCFFGEITASGALQGVEKLNSSPTFKFNDPDSWKYIYRKENQCFFTKEGNKTMKISFVVDGKQVAMAEISAESGNIADVALTKGSCIWT